MQRGILYQFKQDGKADVSYAILKASINSNFFFVNSLADFPTPVAGVITLKDNVTYFITTTVDLLGNRLVAGQNTTILGGSSENCFLISTGLDANTALLSSNWSLPIRNLSITHGTALNLDATGNANQVLDWFGVNFTNCAKVGTIKNYSNFIITDSSLLNSANMVFDGSFATIGFSQCLFSGIAGQTTLNFPSTLTITRRLRIIFSSFIAFAGATAIYVDTNTTFSNPSETYILVNVNFSGGATYTGGVQYNDNKASFKNCVGIINSTTIANMYMQGNSTPTIVSSLGARYAMLGTTQVSSLNQRFTHDAANNALVYSGTVTKVVKIQFSVTLTSGSNNVIGIYVGVNRSGTSIDPTADRLSESEIYLTTSGSRPDAGFIQAVATLSTNDRVYVILQNASSATNITVSYMNMVVEAAID